LTHQYCAQSCQLAAWGKLAGDHDVPPRSDKKSASKRQKPSTSDSIVWHPRVSDYLTLRINIVGKLLERHSARMLTNRFQLTLAERRVLL
jgi:hypothetical protein